MLRQRCILACIIALGFSYAQAQLPEFATSPNVANALTRVIGTDRVVTAGLFVGLNGDSIYLSVAGRIRAFSRYQIWKLSVERAADRLGPTVSGVMLGIYAGNVFFYRAEGGPFALFESESPFFTVLSGLACGFVGGGVGFLVGSASGGDQSFDFTGSEDANQREWDRLASLVQGADGTSKVHLSFQGAWADTYVPVSDGSYYSGFYSSHDISTLNLMRKLQLTLTLTPMVDAGIAAMWLGQPSSFMYGYPSYGSVQMKGNGYYVVGVVKPLHALTGRNFQCDLGAGLGTANVDYRYQYKAYSYPDTISGVDLSIRKSVFSAVLYAEAKVFLSDYCSLGITGDYVYIPEEIPAIPSVNVEKRTMSTTSIGFVLGLHF